MTSSAHDETHLVTFLRQHPIGDSSFLHPEVNYFDRFQRLEQYLNSTVHPDINRGAAIAGDGWLTDHGIPHVKTVIRRASDLVVYGDSVLLTPYEVFLLLLAIHFHDVGNVFGRGEHEKNITQVMQQIDESTIGSDGLEKRVIRDIAMAHAGYVDTDGYDKDTIGRLKWEIAALPEEPRVRFLAALLRFADELADDHTRTSRFLIDSKLVSKSEIYHVYADRLRQVTVRPSDRKVLLHFELDISHVTMTYKKGHEDVYLYDEIVARALKMYRESIYCRRFMQPYISVDSIDISIVVTHTNYMTVMRKIRFSLAQQGYPDLPKCIHDVSPDAPSFDGETLRAELSSIAPKATNGQQHNQ